MAAGAIFTNNETSENRIKIQYTNNQKHIIFNDNPITDRRDIMLNMPCIVFCHGDLDFVTGSPDKKRTFFDQTLSLIDKEYVSLLRNYKTVLKNRNKLLKNNGDRELISIYTTQLVEFGLVIQSKREKIVKEFNSIISRMFEDISGLEGLLQIEYISSWKKLISSELITYIQSKLEYELKMKSSCYGPHRDNFKYSFNNKDFNQFASTGQLRLLSLLLRSAQGIVYSKINQRNPILLLDDVLLELDNEKRALFMNNLPAYEQAFYTFLPDSSALKNHNAKIFRVEDGDISY